MTLWWSDIPTQVDAVCACMYLFVCMCVLIKRLHTSDCGSVCRFIGATGAFNAYIPSYQRLLIAPSVSEQKHVCTSIHKASFMHSLCPPCPIFFFYYLKECGCTQTHVYTGNILYIASGDINNLNSGREIHDHGIHVKQTVTPLLLRQNTHTHKAFPRRAVKHIPVHRGTAWILTVILLHWRGLSCPESSLAPSRLAFSLLHIKPVSQGSTLCVSASFLWCFIHFDGILYIVWGNSLYCIMVNHCSKPNVDFFLLMCSYLTDLKLQNETNHCLLRASSMTWNFMFFIISWITAFSRHLIKDIWKVFSFSRIWKYIEIFLSQRSPLSEVTVLAAVHAAVSGLWHPRGELLSVLLRLSCFNLLRLSAAVTFSELTKQDENMSCSINELRNTHKWVTSQYSIFT